ncbi:MAG: lactate utilization protein [Bacteroidota bacterium]|nr:lactate utilization protein [Bacteroidota bacterium]
MKESTSREKILKKVRNALIHKSSKPESENIDFESPIYSKQEESAEITFAQKFTALNGKFAFCENTKEFESIIKEFSAEAALGEIYCAEESIKELLTNAGIKHTDNPAKLTSCEVSVTNCEYLIARTGSIMISSRQSSGRKLPVFPDKHIVVAYSSQLVDDIKDALKAIKLKYADKAPSLISLISGPSRTADIEKTLILGAHGPKEIYLFLIDDATI